MGQFKLEGTLGQSGTPEWRFQMAFTRRVHSEGERGSDGLTVEGKRKRDCGSAVCALRSMYVWIQSTLGWLIAVRLGPKLALQTHRVSV